MRDTASKLVDRGTHRVRTLEQTWDVVLPKARAIGVTRVSNVTWLDEFGIPVWQAVRPLGKSLSVAQGKGISDMAAKCSAVMEAIECHYAENLTVATVTCSVAEMAGRAGYDPMELPTVDATLMHASTILEWIPATFLASGRSTFIPKKAVDLDMARGQYNPPLLHLSTTGLASGNTRTEALCHGLYEAIERDATTRNWTATRQADQRVLLDDNSIAKELADQIETRGARLSIIDLVSRTGVPTYGATIWSPAFPLQCAGFGSHFDPQVALCRAITEAAQSRLTVISGARDDVRVHWMDALAAADAEDQRQASDFDYRPLNATPDGAYRCAPDIERDLEQLVSVTESTTGRSVIAVDLSPGDAGFAVVKVFCTGLLDKRESHA